MKNSQDGDNDINGDNDMINFLLENNANIHIKNNNKYDALLMGIRTVNNTDVVKTIIKKGANINAQDEKGNTPLMLAINFESAYMVELLIEEGANVNLANNEGMTPLEIASTNSFLHPNIVRDLISAMSN
jgi:ankyrin repeat protein